MYKFFFFFLFFFSSKIYGQTTVSDIALTDYKRVEQLKDSMNFPSQSFVIRSSSLYWSDLLYNQNKAGKKHSIQLLQSTYTLQDNSKLPVSYNDGSLYPSVGLQQRVSIGVFAQWKRFSLLLQPELVNAANTDPALFQWDTTDHNYWAKYYLYVVNKIDNFDRFGTTPFTKVFWGQSSFLYNTNVISCGVSTENLWWGPSIRNSLVLSNNAPGFLHFTLHSRRPITTKLGNIEFQVIAGALENVSTEAPDNELMRTIWADGIYKKSNTSRGIIGYVFSWNPKWTPNLHIGLTGANYFYLDNVTTHPTNLILDNENKKGGASLGAIFVRYAMPKEQAEVYAEYGRANRLANPFNIIGDTIPTGYILGFRKLFIQSNHSAIELGFELTQLQLPDARLIFNKDNVFGIPRTNSWYTHPYIAQGYTNDGQVIGASIGPGSNSETLNISWVKGMKRIGIQAERVSHNNDYYFYNYFSGIVGSGTANKYWVDLNLGLQFQWDFKNVLLSGYYNYTSALNYRWIKLDGGFAGPSTLSDKTNSKFSLSIAYFFSKP